MERPLKKAADFVRFAGEKAKLKLRNAVQGQKVLVGKLGPVEGSNVAVVDGSKTWNVPLEDVVNAHLVFELAPTPKKGGKKK